MASSAVPAGAFGSRLPLVDILKILAAHLVVLHHFAAYGPISEAMEEAAPHLVAWLYDYARMAVQAFLVIGGYLAARSLSGRTAASPLATLAGRYRRLALPYLAALALAIVGAALARRWLTDDFVPDAPTFAQWAAHALLLHSLLGVESLSAGVWYVAIDFQLYALLAALFWLARRIPAVLPALVVLLTAASLFWLNRDPELDVWAPYFFGAYGLGVMARWASASARPAPMLALIAALGLLALDIDFRERILIAATVALALGLAGGWRLRATAASELLGHLGAISYSLFLVHFPVYLVANALFARFELTGPEAGVAALALAWGASLLAAAFFHRWVELPSAGLSLPLPRLRPA